MTQATFERIVCWELAQVGKVMNTEALQPQDEVFLATHHPVRMYKQELKRPDTRVPYDQGTLLRDFLAPSGYAFVPVLGSAGTGKSHLVRWLWLSIPKSLNRKVVLIPRGGTNLRGVIELILRDMEGPTFDTYRDRLSRATMNLSFAQARNVLLDNLALAVGPDGGYGDSDAPAVPPLVVEAQDHLRKFLPALLRDQFFRSHLLADGGIIDQLTRHVLGSTDAVERREHRRQFAEEDLPLAITDYKQAGADARLIFGELASDQWLRSVAIDWLNLHLEEAIGRLLQLGGADLTNLMRDVRAALAKQGIELIVLIEDFARLQGIERQLLDALLEQPNQPDRQLCVLRTAIACTTSYFEKVEDTVRQRTSFVVSLDREVTGNEGIVTAEDFQQFAARYLNAVRLGEDELSDWYRRRRAGGDDEPVPSKCATCPYQDACHEGFGAQNGMGLYPFNPTALEEMYERVGADGFSPRLLITDVLRRTLEGYGDNLENGSFPPPALLSGLGGSRLTAATRAEIAEFDIAHTARREVLLELWAGGRVVDLHSAVHSAFDLPLLNVSELVPSGPVPEPPRPSPEKPKSTGTGLPRKLQETLIALDRWQNGIELPQGVTNDLREAVYYAVENRIDWDSRLLIKGDFAAATSTAPFRQRSINFHNQATQHTTALVHLTLPLDGEDLTATAIALQGLALFTHFGNWGFDWERGGPRYQRVYARQLELWAEAVLTQIERTFLPSGDWTPVPAAVELLALGTRLAGGLSPLRPSTEELVDAVFRPVSANAATGRAKSWSELLRVLTDQRDALSALVNSRVAAVKGTDRRFSIVDAAKFTGVLESLSADWRPKSPIPGDLPDRHFDSLRLAREAADRLLDVALEEECQRQITEFDAVAIKLGDAQDHKAVAEAARQAMARAREGGVFSGSPEESEKIIQSFRTSAFISWRDSVERIRSETDPRQLIGLLSQDHSKASAVASSFVDHVDRFLSRAIDRAESEVAVLEEQGGRDLDATFGEIEYRLDALMGAVNEISGVPA